MRAQRTANRRGKVRAKAIWIMFFTIPAALAALFWAGTGRAESGASEQLDPRLRAAADYLNEFGDRRRVQVYFANRQSVFYGARVEMVNVGRGNLTFLRRDLVTAGRLPLVAGRVYDSSLGEGADFGPGWRLSGAETIETLDKGHLLWRDETATAVELAPAGQFYVPVDVEPGQKPEIRRVGASRIEILRRNGISKEFTLLGDRYRLTRVVDRNGNAIDLEYEQDRLARMENESGRFLEFKRDESGRIVSIRDDRSRKVEYRYNQLGLLEEVRDLGGSRWSYQYDAADRLQAAIDPLGHAHLQASYDAGGRVSSLKSRGAFYRYDYSPGRTLVSDGSGRSSLFLQNEAGVTTAVRNFLGVETSLELDPNNRVRKLQRNGAPQGEMSYDGEGRLISLLRYNQGKAQAIDYFYNESGLLERVEGPDGFEFLRYDGRGNLLERVTDEGSRKYRYSERGDLLEMELEEGRKYRFQTDREGQITTITDPEERATRFSYQRDGKLRQVIFSDGSGRLFHYNRMGLRDRVDFEDGSRVDYRFNDIGSLIEIEVRNSDGGVTGQTLILDEEQKTIESRPFGGEPIGYRYDDRGNLLSAVQGERRASFGYDALGRLTEVVDADGMRVAYSYSEQEPDLRRQLDRTTGLNVSGRSRGGQTFDSALQLFRNRSAASDFGAVRFDQEGTDFRLSLQDGAALPRDNPKEILTRLRILDLGSARRESKSDFTAPSNVFFLPPEFSTVNCCPPGCFGLVFDPLTGEDGTTQVEPPCSTCQPGGGGGGGTVPCTVTILEETIQPCFKATGNSTDCVDPAKGGVQNPAELRTGTQSVFRATQNPIDCPVTWSITSGPGSIVGASTGTLVTVKGNSTGTIVLRATTSSGDFDEVSVPVVNQRNVNVKVYIVPNMDGTPSATHQRITKDIEVANVLWAQCGVQFTLVSVATLADFSGRFWDTTVDSPACSQSPGDEFCDLVDLFAGTGAFEVYYVNTLTGVGGNVGQVLSGVTDAKGLAIAAKAGQATSRTLAHELGHALGIVANSGTQDLHLMEEHKSEFKADIRLTECQTVASKKISSSQ